MELLNNTYKSIALFAILAFTQSACVDQASNPVATPDTPPVVETMADYTVMLYTAGGGDLDYNLEMDMRRAATAMEKPDSRVRILVQYKYSNYLWNYKYNTPVKEEYPHSGKASHVYRYEVTHDLLNDTTGRKPFIKLNDGMLYGNQHAKAEFYQPDSLANFIRYCQRTAPAKNYILVVSDHGGGYTVIHDYDKSLQPQQTGNSLTRGCVYDDHLNDAAISIKELRQGIERSGVKLKMLNFDCCLMNMMENLSELIGLTDYTLASGHTTYGEEWGSFVKHLRQAADTGNFEQAMTQYAETICDFNRNLYTKQNATSARDVDFALTDMRKFPAVLTALKAFTDYIVDNFPKLTKEELASLDIPATSCYQYYWERPFYDLEDYCNLLANVAYDGYRSDSELMLLRKKLTAAIDEAQVTHVYSYNSDDRDAYRDLSYSVTLGSKGLIFYRQDPEKPWLVTCYNHLGEKVIYDVISNQGEKQGQAIPAYAWSNSYRLTAFDQQTGWSRWMMLNPEFPVGNPPTTKFYDNIEDAYKIQESIEREKQDTGNRVKLTFWLNIDPESRKAFNTTVYGYSTEKGQEINRKLYSQSFNTNLTYGPKMPEKVQFIMTTKAKDTDQDVPWLLKRQGVLTVEFYNTKDDKNILKKETFDLSLDLKGDHLSKEADEAAKKAYVNIVLSFDDKMNVKKESYPSDQHFVISKK